MVEELISYLQDENNTSYKLALAREEISMEFPIYDLTPATVPIALLKALGLEEILNCVFNSETNIRNHSG